MQTKRLSNLIEFAKQTALLRVRPISEISKHGIFEVSESDILGLPGVHVNLLDNDEGDEVWLTIDRLSETPAPAPESVVLSPWIEISKSTSKEPIILQFVIASSIYSEDELKKRGIEGQTPIPFEAYESKGAAEEQFRSYLLNVWKPWSVIERERRKTISLYSKLFALKQQLDGDLGDGQLELAWGVGVAVWKTEEFRVEYPMITQLVEISMNEKTLAISIRPRETDPRAELEIFTASDNPGIVRLDASCKEFFSQADFVLSPFDRSTFEPILRSAVGNLDPNGKFWPENTSENDRTVPRADENLKVTDTWVIFARPRNANIFLDDLARFQGLIEKGGDDLEIIESAISSIVTDPALSNEEALLPSFRGLSTVSGTSRESGSQAKDLFFPMPYNDEQVRIVQLLESSNGVVVQGPPGTGKTHTIANVICHYLATGKKVLVTSMKDPALGVLREKLPLNIRPLAVSLLSSEQEGIKLFEFAVSKIASEIQRIDRIGLRREIEILESDLDSYHSRLARNSAQIARIASGKLKAFEIDGEKIFPDKAASEIVSDPDAYLWLTDDLSTDEGFAPRFSEGDVATLRDARKRLGVDLDYLGLTLPEVNAFPDPAELVRTHKDLSESKKIQSKIDSGEIPQLADSSKETFEKARKFFEEASNLRSLKRQSESAPIVGRDRILASFRSRGTQSPEFALLWKTVKEVSSEFSERIRFVERPVSIPENAQSDVVFMNAVRNLSEGKSAFSFLDLGKSEQKKMVAGIRIIADFPKSPEEWGHVLSFLNHRKKLQELAVRWNSVASDIGLPAVTASSEGSKDADGLGTACELLRKISDLESVLKKSVESVFGQSFRPEEIYEEGIMEVMEKALSFHLTKNQLAEAWAIKERYQAVVASGSGRISQAMRIFLNQKIGNPDFDEEVVKSEWTALLEELRRVESLRPTLNTVSEIVELIADSGAKMWAERLLSEPARSDSDQLLPGNWRNAWRLRRLANHLESTGAALELRSLAREKKQLEDNLARVYREIVEKRSWLSVSENATPSIRSALMAYMSAIAKIGKGTGKRAIRYRKDARQAASTAHSAVPCWIMPHYRVSESFPADFGLFDLIVIDEASQSDLTALPAILRAKKVLVVGDDKQVSPEGIGFREEDIKSLSYRYLSDQVDTFRPQMTPERSIYDLFKVAFAKSSIMLREHFRCVSPIIEYSKREFYNHEIVPLRMPKTSERLDPPLVDVFVSNGYRKGDVNPLEARFIVDEIRAIVSNPGMRGRSIGVVSLLADKQAMMIREMVETDIGIEAIRDHHIAFGDARTFQGKERDIMFLSMVVSPGEASALSRESFAQRFNVAASRARDRMYLVRSVRHEDLSNADIHRKSLLAHFSLPFSQDETRVEDLRKLCESGFETEVYDLLVERGYRVIPQVKVGAYRIDMVIEGHNDARIAIECDGDRYHGADVWDDDMRRQGILERAGWTFWRCFASDFTLRREEVLLDLFDVLNRMGIDPIGHEGARNSVYVEKRTVEIGTEDITSPDTKHLGLEVIQEDESINFFPAKSDFQIPSP